MKTSFHTLLLAALVFSSFSAFSQDNTEKKVFRTEHGSKYHTICRYSKDATEITLKDAEQAGLKKCGICKKAENTDPTEKITESIICKGTTTKGLPCKLRTVDVSGFCHHHREQATKADK